MLSNNGSANRSKRKLLARHALRGQRLFSDGCGLKMLFSDRSVSQMPLRYRFGMNGTPYDALRREMLRQDALGNVLGVYCIRAEMPGLNGIRCNLVRFHRALSQMARLDGFIGNFVRKYALIRDFRSRHRLFHQLHRMDGLIGKLGACDTGISQMAGGYSVDADLIGTDRASPDLL